MCQYIGTIRYVNPGIPSASANPRASVFGRLNDRVPSAIREPGGAAGVLERAVGASEARMAKRSGHAVSGGREGRREREARGCRQPRRPARQGQLSGAGSGTAKVAFRAKIRPNCSASVRRRPSLPLSKPLERGSRSPHAPLTSGGEFDLENAAPLGEPPLGRDFASHLLHERPDEKQPEPGAGRAPFEFAPQPHESAKHGVSL